MKQTVHIRVPLADIAHLRRRLDALSPQVQRKLIPRAIREAAKPILKQSRANIRTIKQTRRDRARHGTTQGGKPGSKTGNLRRSLGIVVRIYVRKIVAVIGPRWPLGAHGHLVEYGHRVSRGTLSRGSSDRATAQNTGKVLGFVPPHPFIRPAVHATKGAAAAARNRVLGAGIEAAALGRIL